MNTKAIKTSAVVLIILFMGGIFLMNYLQDVLKSTTLILGVDIYPRWVGAELALYGKSPYSLETRQAIWNEIYGSPNTPTGNPFGFYYPPTIITLFAPFILLGISLKQAAVLGCAAIWAFWGTFVFFWALKIKENSRIIIAILLLSGLFYRPAYSNFILGQMALFCVVMTWTAWISIQRGWNVAGGVCLALALIKPSISLLPVFLLLFINWRAKKLLLSFIVTNLLLLIPPTVLLGWWLPDFLSDLARYSAENETAWNASHVKTAPGIFNLILSTSLLILSWVRKDVLMILASAFAVSSLFVPHTADYDLIIFILLIFWTYEQREHVTNGRTLLVLTLLWIPWISLLVFNWKRINHVEYWYVFIWSYYPSILLFIAMTISLKRLSQHQRNKIG